MSETIPSAPPSRGYLLANRVGGVLIALLGAYLVAQGVGYGLLLGGVPTTGAFPALVGGILMLLGASLTFSARREEALRGEDSVLPDRRGWFALGVTFVATVLFLVLLAPLGYVATMLLYVFAVMRAASRQRWWILLIVATAFSVLTFYAFDAGLGIPLPHSHLQVLAWLGF